VRETRSGRTSLSCLAQMPLEELGGLSRLAEPSSCDTSARCCTEQVQDAQRAAWAEARTALPNGARVDIDGYQRMINPT